MEWIDLNAIWRIVVFGLIAGAGLPALFALGMLSLYRGQPRTAAYGGFGGPSGLPQGGMGGRVSPPIGGSKGGRNAPLGQHSPLIDMAGAAICFLIVLAAIGWGVYEIYRLGHAH